MSYSRLIVVFCAFIAAFLFYAKPAYAQENAPQIIVQKSVYAGDQVSVTITTDYPYRELYFTATGGIQQFPDTCKEDFGAAKCETLSGDKHEFHFVLQPATEDVFEIYLFARTTLSHDDIHDAEAHVRIFPDPVKDDQFEVQPGDTSEYLVYTDNDTFPDGNYNGTGIESSWLPFTYTTEHEGAIRLINPITGTFVLTYWVQTSEWKRYGNIVINVTPDGPESRFPQLHDDYINVTEGETFVLGGYTDNDRFPRNIQSNISVDIHDTTLPIESLSGSLYKVISPTTGIYTLTYSVDVLQIGQATAHIYLTVEPKEVPTDPGEQPTPEEPEVPCPGDDDPETPEEPEEPQEPTDLPSEDQPPLFLEYFLPWLGNN